MAKRILIILLLLFGVCSVADSDLVDTYERYTLTERVTGLSLDRNFDYIRNQLNGGVEPVNIKEGYNLIEVLGSLPVAGNEGRTVYLTTKNTFNFDNGSGWVEVPTYAGTANWGNIIYFNGTVWARLAPGTVGQVLRTEGSSADVTWGYPADLTIASQAQGDVLYYNGSSWVRLGAGTARQHLQTEGGSANPVWVEPSNVIFTWSGIEGYASGNSGFYVGTSVQADADSDIIGYAYFVNDQTTYKTFLYFKFKKTAAVDTVTIYARTWQDGNQTMTLNVDIGGAAGTVTQTNVTSPAWATAGTVDVSGLTDGTVYDGIVQLKIDSNGENTYCSAVTLIGS